jgi:Fur family ferric uptake transcriptional regulator/Fur family peroxide stress response transcriptional regulator
MNTKTNIENRLLKFGVKPSLQRMAIMEYLMNNRIHPTAETIFNNLHPSIPTLSKTTVYNTLKLLEEHGAIRSLQIDEKNIRYDADISAHAHFRCKQCGQVYDISIKNFEKLEINNDNDHDIIECQIYYQGYCKYCKIKIAQITN